MDQPQGGVAGARPVGPSGPDRNAPARAVPSGGGAPWPLPPFAGGVWAWALLLPLFQPCLLAAAPGRAAHGFATRGPRPDTAGARRGPEPTPLCVSLPLAGAPQGAAMELEEDPPVELMRTHRAQKDLWMDRPASAMDARSASQPPPGPIQARKAKWVPHAQGPHHREPSLVCDSQGARMDSAPLSGGGRAQPSGESEGRASVWK